MATYRPASLRCEYLTEPLAIAVARPRFSWLPPFDQAAYQIKVTGAWDSGRVKSAESSHVEYAGKPLTPGQRCHWRVRVWNRRGNATPWSAPATFGVAPAWQARWIGEKSDSPWRENEARPSPLLRKSFWLKTKARRATVYASALGLYELRLNGHRVGDQVLAPEWTDYHRRAQFQAQDVTGWLRRGANAFGLMLAPGWYAGRLGLGGFAVGGGQRGFYGRWPRGFVQLHVELADRSAVVVCSDGSWRYTLAGPIRGSDLLDGETYDARRELSGWDAPGFDDAGWLPVEVCHGPQLVAQPNEPIRVTRELRPVGVTQPQPGIWIVDLGQNMVGGVRIKLRGRTGQKVRLRYAEVLNDDGTIYRENLRGAQQVDGYVCRGGGDEVFEPRFTYHGFRYVEVTGLRAPPELVGRVFHSAAPETGEFECSAPLLNKIFTAIQWTQRGNLHSTPTDCPQRDERLGWMGDIQVFAQTAMFNMDLAAFFTKWLRDVRDAQTPDGRFPDFAPQPFCGDARLSANPGWADAGVIVPWRVYVNYGDRRLLADSFPAAERWIEFVHRHNPDLIWRNHQTSPLLYGDWLNSDTFQNLADFPKGKGACPPDVYATAFFAYSTELLAKMARALGRPTRYDRLARDIRAAFNREFVARDGKIKGDTQAGYALALHFDLLPASRRPRAARHLVAGLKPFRGHLSTGIQSTVRAMLELTRWGYAPIAYDLMLKTTIPSWGYMVEHGGTTIWERWDGWVEGRGYQNPGMNSFNHYAIGAVGEWIYRVVLGLNPDETAPGWKHFFVRPIPGGGLTWAKGAYRSIRGPIQVAWRQEAGLFQLQLTVPPNATASVQLPGQRTLRRVAAGTHHFETQTGG